MTAEPGVSADPLDIVRVSLPGKPARTHPEQRAPVWLTRDASAKRKKPRAIAGLLEGDDAISCDAIKLLLFVVSATALCIDGIQDHWLTVNDEAQHRYNFVL